ncbi:MAG: hypothetical protein AcusKO_05410 [Acuticoccus sp.]
MTRSSRRARWCGAISRSSTRASGGRGTSVPSGTWPLFDDTGITLTEDPRGVDVIVATDLRDRRGRDAEDYRDEIAALVDHPAPFVCANPDIVVGAAER